MELYVVLLFFNTLLVNDFLCWYKGLLSVVIVMFTFQCGNVPFDYFADFANFVDMGHPLDFVFENRHFFNQLLYKMALVYIYIYLL